MTRISQLYHLLPFWQQTGIPLYYEDRYLDDKEREANNDKTPQQAPGCFV
jgi:hypothetical protein